MLSLLKSRPRRILAAILLVAYGSAGVFGYGLHAVWHVHHGPVSGSSATSTGHCSAHCCPHTAPLACHEDHRACHEAHTACHDQLPTDEQVVENNPVQFQAVDSDCSICAFLAQAQTPPFVFTLVEFSAPLVLEIPVSEHIAPLCIPAEHLARGPPVC